MSAIEKIKEKLQKHPEVKYKADAYNISVPPRNDHGFRVTFSMSGRRFTVSFNGWHEEFDDEEEAVNCFGLGLSDRTRLKVCSGGRFEYRWAVEKKEDDTWVGVSETGLLFFPFWLKRRVFYLQNDWIR